MVGLWWYVNVVGGFDEEMQIALLSGLLMRTNEEWWPSNKLCFLAQVQLRPCSATSFFANSRMNAASVPAMGCWFIIDHNALPREFVGKLPKLLTPVWP